MRSPSVGITFSAAVDSLLDTASASRVSSSKSWAYTGSSSLPPSTSLSLPGAKLHTSVYHGYSSMVYCGLMSPSPARYPGEREYRALCAKSVRFSYFEPNRSHNRHVLNRNKMTEKNPTRSVIKYIGNTERVLDFSLDLIVMSSSPFDETRFALHTTDRLNFAHPHHRTAVHARKVTVTPGTQDRGQHNF